MDSLTKSILTEKQRVNSVSYEGKKNTVSLVLNRMENSKGVLLSLVDIYR